MNTIFKKIILLFTLLVIGNVANAQLTLGQIQNQIPRDQNGINQFDVKKDSIEFKGLSVDLGAAFALQFQAIDQFNDQPATQTAPISGYRLNNLSNNLNLPTANMTIGAQLADGVRVNLDLYLASRHHHETWVKGGYLQIDKLDFIKEGFASDIMKYATIKIGQMENNYGDAHFRRSDNGNALMNPFVGNNIMDAFTTEPGIEVYYNRSGFVSMLGVTNSKLNQDVKEIKAGGPGQNTTISPTFLAKIGFDKQLSDDLRVRLTGSLYHVSNSSGNLYASDRAGSRFYGVMTHDDYTGTAGPVSSNFDPTSNKDTGRFNPGFGNWATSFMVNPFVKYGGLEVFGTLEFASGGNKRGDDATRNVNQYAGDVVYRFGNKENLYIGAKYNTVSGKLSNADANKININRFESSLGWFMTKNILAKLEYVNQSYKDFNITSGGNPNDLYGGKFKGLVFEAVISF